MKRLSLSFMAIIITFLFINIRTYAYSVEPPYGSIKVSKIYDTDYHSVLGDARRVETYETKKDYNLGYHKVLCIYRFDKTLSLPVKNFDIMYRCAPGQILKHTVTYSKEISQTKTWEERTSRTFGISTNQSLSAIVSIPIVGLNVGKTVSEEFYTTIDKEYIKGTTCTETLGNNTSVSYEINTPGYYIPQLRHAFECYWIQEYIIIYNVNNGSITGESIYLTNHYIKIKQISNSSEYGFYKYKLNSDGVTYSIDQSLFSDTLYRTYL